MSDDLIKYADFEAAHVATNEVIGCAVAAARIRGVRMAIVIFADVEDRKHPNCGVETYGCNGTYDVVQALGLMLGTLRAQEAKRLKAIADEAQAIGAQHSEALLDRSLVATPPEEP